MACLIVFGYAVFLSYNQFIIWLTNPLSKYLLPPYQSINYFLFYVFGKFFATSLLSLFIGLFFFGVVGRLNKKYDGRFFEVEEPYLAGLGIFLSGHPGWLVYLAVLISFYLLLHLGRRLKGERNARVPLYHLWIPTALFVILINEFWLSRAFWWGLLKM